MAISKHWLREAVGTTRSKRSIKRIFALISLMFFISVVYILKIVVLDSEFLMTNSYNPRINSTDTSIKRGNIYDCDGNLMAYSEKEGEIYKRVYIDGENSAHVLGYVDAGKSGIEAAQNFTMQKLDNELTQRMLSVFKEDEIEGNSVKLTIDSYLQKIGSDLMRTNNGAVVVLEVKTGKVVCMVSKPGYNPQTVAEDWEMLRESENSQLLNRASQGVYTPGSTFKMITAVSAMRNLSDIYSYKYNCKGSAVFDGKVIHCFNDKAHGEVDITSAFAESCNCFFAEIGTEIGAAKLRETADSLGFNSSFEFDLPSSVSKVSIEADSKESEIVETAIGQGKTLATPLFMASLAAAAANEGIVMEPYIVEDVINYKGKTLKRNLPKSLGRIFSNDECQKLNEMMIEVVNNGTGFNAKSQYFQVAGKTGTAENPAGADHLWFVGYAPAEKPEYAVAVVLENGDGSMNPAVIARKMLYNSIEKENR